MSYVNIDNKVGLEQADKVMTFYHEKFRAKGLTLIGEKTTASWVDEENSYKERIGLIKHKDTVLVYHLDRSNGDSDVTNTALIVATNGPKKKEIRKLFREVFSTA